MKQKVAYLLLVGFFLPSHLLLADTEPQNKEFHINIDAPTIARGYTVAAFGDNIKLSLVPGILSEATDVDVLELHEMMPEPWTMDRLSPVYQFEFKNKAAYDDHKPFYIQLSYPEKNDDYKQVYFYDKNTASWRPLPTRDYPEDKFVRSLIHLPFARIAVFSYPGTLTVGQASWYAYKGGNYAASPDFPKGSILRVTNRENGKFVDVEVNDYGPDRSLHPDRPIDLDKTAFAAIAPLWQGVIPVKVEPLEIAPDDQGQVLGVAAAGVGTEPEIDLWSAVIMDEESGEIIYGHKATTTLPLASLTKMVAIKVFLESRPSLDTVVAYSSKDADYNYEWVKEWESARVRLNDGDKLTVEDLIYSSLTGSANNTVETLVRASGLKRPAFIGRMNSRVAEWGAESTYFAEPTGLSPQNVSSAADYAIISREVLKNPIIAKASTMPEYTFYTLNSQEKHRIRNTNHIIRTNEFNITGSKTGYLHESLYCLMTRVEEGDKSVIVVTMGAATRDDSFNMTSDLMRYGLKMVE